MIFWAVLVKRSEVHAHLQDIRVLFWHQHRIGEPAFLDLAYEFGLEESVDLYSDCLCPWLRQSPDCLIVWPCVAVDVECVLGEFPRNSWHVRRTPGENFPVLTEEFDEREFLCGTQVVGDEGRLGGIRWVDLHFLCVHRRVKGQIG